MQKKWCFCRINLEIT